MTKSVVPLQSPIYLNALIPCLRVQTVFPASTFSTICLAISYSGVPASATYCSPSRNSFSIRVFLNPRLDRLAECSERLRRIVKFAEKAGGVEERNAILQICKLHCRRMRSLGSAAQIDGAPCVDHLVLIVGMELEITLELRKRHFGPVNTFPPLVHSIAA